MICDNILVKQNNRIIIVMFQWATWLWWSRTRPKQLRTILSKWLVMASWRERWDDGWICYCHALLKPLLHIPGRLLGYSFKAPLVIFNIHPCSYVLEDFRLAPFHTWHSNAGVDGQRAAQQTAVMQRWRTPVAIVLAYLVLEQKNCRCRFPRFIDLCFHSQIEEMFRNFAG